MKESVLRCLINLPFCSKILNAWISKTHDPLCVACCSCALAGNRDLTLAFWEFCGQFNLDWYLRQEFFSLFVNFIKLVFKMSKLKIYIKNMRIFMRGAMFSRCRNVTQAFTEFWTHFNRHSFSNIWSLLGQQGQLWTYETWHFLRTNPGDVIVTHLFSHWILHGKRSGRI